MPRQKEYLRKRSKEYGEGRKCKCGRKLSKYNSESSCSICLKNTDKPVGSAASFIRGWGGKIGGEERG